MPQALFLLNLCSLAVLQCPQNLMLSELLHVPVNASQHSWIRKARALKNSVNINTNHYYVYDVLFQNISPTSKFNKLKCRHLFLVVSLSGIGFLLFFEDMLTWLGYFQIKQRATVEKIILSIKPVSLSKVFIAILQLQMAFQLAEH